MSNERNLKKEAEWKKKVYKRFEFACRTDNGELEALEKALNGRSFPDWVREKMKEQ